MTDNPFAAPAASSGIKWDVLKGALLLIEVLGIETEIPTVHGATDAVRANVTALDGPLAGDEYPNCLVFPRVLQGQLWSRVGAKVLGRLTQGTAKPGQSAPWLLAEGTEADIAVGKAYLAGALKTPAGAGADQPPF